MPHLSLLFNPEMALGCLLAIIPFLYLKNYWGMYIILPPLPYSKPTPHLTTGILSYTPPYTAHYYCYVNLLTIILLFSDFTLFKLPDLTLDD